MMALEVINLKQWVSENQSSFLPPVCNKMMHNSQLKVMCVGGPNIRKDYHIEEGEEFFYMLKGDMCLKVIEKGVHKDVVIKEGQTFLLPARIPHSPQRFENTVGLVIERERLPKETDVLRYYVGETLNVLYEKTFHSVDLGTELVGIITEYFKSEAYQTNVPDQNNILDDLPFQLDSITDLGFASNLNSLVTSAGDSGSKLFKGDHQFDIRIRKHGSDNQCVEKAEHWIWQLEGDSVVTAGGKELVLHKNDTLLLPPGSSYTWVRSEASCALQVVQDGGKK